MKKNDYSPSATNAAGIIKSPKGVRKDEPKATKITATNDLRAQKRG